MGRILIALGVLLILAGLLVTVGVRLGRLPGDIVIRGRHGAFYFPIVTCILISVALSLLLRLLRR